jgi:hypothetical protein|tara:strand:+ start:311 stop:541 length:231 start_codon:yes stop_codon:yes gene_type:complete
MTTKILNEVIEILESDTQTHDNEYALGLLNKIKVWNNMENQRMIDVDRGRLRPTSEDIIRLMVERGNIVIHEDRHE